MRRLSLLLTTAFTMLLVAAPSALAHDGGQGLLGNVDDKQVTNAGFILIVFFPTFVLVMSLIMWQLEKRKDRRKAGAKQAEGTWHSGW